MVQDTLEVCYTKQVQYILVVLNNLEVQYTSSFKDQLNWEFFQTLQVYDSLEVLYTPLVL